MHDIAQDVAGKEICAANCIMSDLDKKIRHLSLCHYEGIMDFFNHTSRIRTCFLLNLRESVPAVGPVLGNLMCLRALELRKSDMKCLPDIVGKLLQSRYLDLSSNHDLEALPKSITNLQNLQTLNVASCSRLKELPRDLRKLVKLRVLDIGGCYELKYLPLGLDQLSCLHTLPLFPVGWANSAMEQHVIDELENLKALANLKGYLEMQIQTSKGTTCFKENGSEGKYLRSKENLKKICIEFTGGRNENDGREDYEEALLEELQPSSSLKGLKLEGFNGVRMPSWARRDNLGTFLPNLVEISLKNCQRLQCLESLGELHHLKHLTLENVRNLEYMENTNSSRSYAAAELSFFPSLEKLQLVDLPQLKGWWKGQPLLLSSFPHLSYLNIRSCPELTCFPLCPSLETLYLSDFNERMRMILRDHKGGGATSSPTCYQSTNSKLRLCTNNITGCLKVVQPVEAFQDVTKMMIQGDKKIKYLSEVREVFKSCSSSLRSLAIFSCKNLRSLCGAVEHLTALEMLFINDAQSLSNAEDEEGEDDDGIPIPWSSLPQSLRSLQLRNLPQLVNLPKGLQYLTSLQSLQIARCQRLESIPEFMRKLTSLKQLAIIDCSPGLYERCRNPTGEDLPNIQHIPHIAFTEF